MEKSEDIINIEIDSKKMSDFTYTEPFYVNQMKSNILLYIPENYEQEIDQLVQHLDAFYADGDNLRIPVTVSIRIILARDNGDIDRADFWLKEARRSSLKELLK